MIIALVCVIVFRENRQPVQSPVVNKENVYQSTNIKDTGNSEVSIVQDPSNPGVSTYTSHKLGIRFSYQNSMSVGSKAFGNIRTVVITPTETGNIIDLNGHTIEVFTKDSKDTLAQAIEKKFLTGYSSADCFVEMRNTNGVYQKASISYPAPVDPNEPFWANSAKCPQNYSKTNGVSYFMYNTEQSDRFVFIMGGQDVAALSPDGKSDFLSTVEIIDRQ